MWWFIGTFVLGMAVGRYRLLPTAFLRRPNWFVFPTLMILLVLLGIQVGRQPEVIEHLGNIGWQSLVITVCAMAGSALCAFATHKFFFRRRDEETLSGPKEEQM